MLVADRMQREVITIDREASLRRARRIMEHHHIQHLPVTEARRLVGILSDRDIRLAAPSAVSSLTSRERDEFMDYIRVGQVMTRRIISVTSRTSLAEAARMMVRYRIGCLPVVEDHLLVGILTAVDLMGVLGEMLGAGAEVDRLEVQVPDAPASLTGLLEIAGAHRAHMMSLLNLPAGRGSEARALLRFQGDPEVLCAALGAAGFRVAFRPAERVEDELILEHLGRS